MQLLIPSVILDIVSKALYGCLIISLLFCLEIAPYFRERDEEKKKSLRENAENETIPYYFSRLNNQVKKNNGYLSLRRV